MRLPLPARGTLPDRPNINYEAHTRELEMEMLDFCKPIDHILNGGNLFTTRRRDRRDVANPFATLAMQNKVADFARYRRSALGVGGRPIQQVMGKQIKNKNGPRTK